MHHTDHVPIHSIFNRTQQPVNLFKLRRQSGTFKNLSQTISYFKLEKFHKVIIISALLSWCCRVLAGNRVPTKPRQPLALAATIRGGNHCVKCHLTAKLPDNDAVLLCCAVRWTLSKHCLTTARLAGSELET